ncbi:L,D-transpeptidase family protein [Vibrio sp. CAU 1672]|uniref:L,D-transpeptidase family protein n=1 Tax=Vibrio sp. CAU 1672 TaxID=3032594 RepID=UPI0023DA9AC5|nr:L,D-transpeptidase family protein [Vibrio sp. CAU 1672]MDF2155779.1 L,D-transpeptidase family protein [Vibrio sp. CAU 1672]
MSVKWGCVLLCSLLSVGASAAVELVKVDKSKRRMYLIEGEQVLKEFRIALGKNPQGHKQQEGDHRTPEGEYTLDYIIENSAFYRSVHISYPDAKDLLEAERRGVSPGGDIKIHGLRNDETQSPQYVQSFDWTSGCIALTNDELDEFIEMVPMGTPILIEW